jgi:hypothetical protein
MVTRLTGTLANRGSMPWTTIGTIYERVQELIARFPQLQLKDKHLGTRAGKPVEPQGTQTAADIRRNGVVFKHWNHAGGVLTDRDRAAREPTKGDVKHKVTKGGPHQTPNEDVMTVLLIPSPDGLGPYRSIIPHKAVALHDAFNTYASTVDGINVAPNFIQELWHVCSHCSRLPWPRYAMCE